MLSHNFITTILFSAALGSPLTSESRKPTSLQRRAIDWQNLGCQDPSLSGSASSKWTSAGGADAWNDMVAKWTSSSALPDTDISHWAADYFHASNANFFCGVIDENNPCGTGVSCGAGVGGPLSPAGTFILNSMSQIWDLHSNLYSAVKGFQGTLVGDAPSFTAAIAPEQDNGVSEGLQLFMEVLSTCFSMISATSWKGFTAGTEEAAAAKGAAAAEGGGSETFFGAAEWLIENGATIVKDDGSATADALAKQNQIANQITTLCESIKKGLVDSTKSLFKGDKDSLTNLGTMLANGTFLSVDKLANELDLQDQVAKIVYWEVTLNYWNATKSRVAIIASNAPCSAQNPLKLVDPGVQQQTWACINDQLFYLVLLGSIDPCVEDSCPQPQYYAPDGINDLAKFGKLERGDFISGAVASWAANGKKNGWKITNFKDPASSGTDWFNFNVDVPGASWIPVCSEQEMNDNMQAKLNLAMTGDEPWFPCNKP